MHKTQTVWFRGLWISDAYGASHVWWATLVDWDWIHWPQTIWNTGCCHTGPAILFWVQVAPEYHLIRKGSEVHLTSPRRWPYQSRLSPSHGFGQMTLTPPCSWTLKCPSLSQLWLLDVLAPVHHGWWSWPWIAMNGWCYKNLNDQSKSAESTYAGMNYITQWMNHKSSSLS